jgi:hypothetical protein
MLLFRSEPVSSELTIDALFFLIFHFLQRIIEVSKKSWLHQKLHNVPLLTPARVLSGDETGRSPQSSAVFSAGQMSPMMKDTGLPHSAPPHSAPPPPPPPRSPRVTYADQRPHSSRDYSEKRPLISPRVFNFYELSPAMEVCASFTFLFLLSFYDGS